MHHWQTIGRTLITLSLTLVCSLSAGCIFQGDPNSLNEAATP